MNLPDPEFSEHFDFMVVFRNGVVADEQVADLNERQQIALRIVREKGSISPGEFRAITGTSERTAYRDLQDLVDRDVFVLRGRRRGTRYYLA